MKDTNIKARLAAALETLKIVSGARKDDIRRVIANIQRKERSGKLPANKGWAFAAHSVKTALWASGFGVLANSYTESVIKSETERAESWIRRAQQP